MMKRSLLFLPLLGIVAQASQAATLTVDDDLRQCKKAQFQSINAAILAAASGDTIRVCPGLYPETVLVSKPLTLLGARHGNAAAKGRQDNPERESIVVNNGLGGFEVVASDVVVSGFTVQGNPAAASYPNAGIDVLPGSNRTIESNVLQDNGLGIYLLGAQQGLDIERNAFLNNRREPNPFFIPAGGLFAAGGRVNDAAISNNYFTGNEQFSINIGDGSDQNLVIAHNEAVDDGAFVVIGRSTDTLIHHNRVDGHRGSGIFAFGDNFGLVIEHNLFERGLGSGIVFTLNFGATQPNANAVVQHNRVSNSQGNGIRVDATLNATVEYNRLEDNVFHGIRLLDADNNRIAHNDARNNGRDGILADAGSSGNTIERNKMRDNVEHDAHDNTAGPGTAGTANFWIDNQCETENRPGLCSYNN